MKRYDSYKDSGVEWIGEIPNGWRKSKIKYHFNLLSGFPFNSEEITNEEREFPIIRIGNVTSGKTDVYFDGELLKKHPKVENGEYIVSLTGDFSIRKWENQTSLLNQRCGLMKNISMDDVRYLFYFLPFQFRILEKTKYFTTLKNLSNGELLDLDFIIPPLSEQQQIVSFLDSKTSQIDELIQKKERKIELLKEYRTSLINQVVTKGLNPIVEMKDSGVEWIGEIPSHWEKKKIGYVSKLFTGNPWKSELFNFENGIKIVRGENVSEGFLRWGSRTRFWVEPIEEDSIFYLKVGDIVIGMDGSKVGKNYVRIKEGDLPLLLHQRMCRIRVSKGCSPKFIEYWIGSEMFRFYIDISKTDPMIPHITQKNIFDFQIPFPSLTEQLQIVYYLDEQTQKIDSSIQTEEKKIELLKEYRQSLISSVVTGKIDVRTN